MGEHFLGENSFDLKDSDKAFRLLQFIFRLLKDSYGSYNISPNIGHFPEVHVEY